MMTETSVLLGLIVYPKLSQLLWKVLWSWIKRTEMRKEETLLYFHCKFSWVLSAAHSQSTRPNVFLLHMSTAFQWVLLTLLLVLCDANSLAELLLSSFVCFSGLEPEYTFFKGAFITNLFLLTPITSLHNAMYIAIKNDLYERGRKIDFPLWTWVWYEVISHEHVYVHSTDFYS